MLRRDDERPMQRLGLQGAELRPHRLDMRGLGGAQSEREWKQAALALVAWDQGAGRSTVSRRCDRMSAQSRACR